MPTRHLTTVIAILLVSVIWGCNTSCTQSARQQSPENLSPPMVAAWARQDSVGSATMIPGRPDVLLVHSEVGWRGDDGAVRTGFVMEIVSPSGEVLLDRVVAPRSHDIAAERFQIDGSTYVAVVGQGVVMVMQVSQEDLHNSASSIAQVGTIRRLIGSRRLVDLVQDETSGHVYAAVKNIGADDEIYAIDPKGVHIWSASEPYLFSIVANACNDYLYCLSTRGLVQRRQSSGSEANVYTRQAIAFGLNQACGSPIDRVVAVSGWTDQLRATRANGSVVWTRALRTTKCMSAYDMKISVDGHVLAISDSGGNVELVTVESGKSIASGKLPPRAKLIWTRLESSDENVLIGYSLSGVAAFVVIASAEAGGTDQAK